MTHVDVVYAHFLELISDDEMAILDDDIIEGMMFKYLEKASVNFPQCNKDLSIVEENYEYYIKADLDLDEVVILSYEMMYWWLYPKILREENLKQQLTDHDYVALSGANMLLRLYNLSDRIKTESSRLKMQYSLKGFKGWN